MNCPAGQIPTKDKAISDTDGCQDCPISEYTLGGDTAMCQPMNCNKGFKATKTAAINDKDGCTECPIGK